CSLVSGLSSAWRPLRNRTRPHKKPLPREVEKLLRFALAPLEHFHFHQTRACTRHHMLAEKTSLATDRLELRRLQLVAVVGSSFSLKQFHKKRARRWQDRSPRCGYQS